MTQAHSLDTINLFGLDIVSATTRDALDRLLNRDKRYTAAFLNAHCVNTADGDRTYRSALEKADFILPDGSGLNLAARMQGKRFVENLNGTDLFVPLCREAAKRGLSIYFLGSRENIARIAALRASALAPGLVIAGTRNGFFERDEEHAIVDEINASGADIVLVALGVPLQEIWIERNRERLSASLVMGVGAQFDFWSGEVRRAPMLFRKTGMEWLWRLALEPKRMARRYIRGNPEFMLRAWRDRKPDASPVKDPVKGPVKGKRVLDLFVASAAIIALSPAIGAIAAAIRLTSRGPVFFRQERVGLRGKTFTLYKFRTMCVDAEQQRAVVLKMSDRPGLCFKAKDDPRITPVGRFLRRYSLDELPQLFNVVLNQMSIVGPRPALPQEVAAYPGDALRRLDVKPGLTGLWQVSGRADIGFDRMIEMDSAYARSRTLLLDFAIMALTLRAVLSGRGSY